MLPKGGIGATGCVVSYGDASLITTRPQLDHFPETAYIYREKEKRGGMCLKYVEG